MDEKSFELFREKMKAAAAQIAAIKKEEGKQKKKEEELLKILLKFVKTSQKKELVLLVSRALEQNLPANFILAIILLADEEIEREIGSYLMLKAGVYGDGAGGGSKSVGAEGSGGEGVSLDAQEKALVFFREDETMPLKIKIELDMWLKSLLFQAEENPQKLLKTAYDIEMRENDRGEMEENRTIKVVLIQLIAHVMREFLNGKNFPNDYNDLLEFSKFVIRGILNKVEEGVRERKLLK